MEVQEGKFGWAENGGGNGKKGGSKGSSACRLLRWCVHSSYYVVHGYCCKAGGRGRWQGVSQLLRQESF